MKYDLEIYVRHRYSVEAESMEKAIDIALSGNEPAKNTKVVGVYGKDEGKMKVLMLENMPKNTVQ